MRLWSAPRFHDALLAAGVFLILAAFITADVEGTQPEVWTYLWAAGFGALMFIRRTYPVLVVVLSVLGFLAYYASGFTAIGTAVPIAAAVFSAAECGRLPAAAAGSAVVVAVSLVYRLSAGQDAAFVLAYDLPQNLLILGGAVGLGDSIRSRRELQRQSSRIAELTARQYRRDAQERITAERLAVSRDLHDSMGHSLAVISLHTEVAREAGTDDAARQQALEVIRSTTAEAGSELRRTVAGLRNGGPGSGGEPGIQSLGSAVAPAQSAGLEVSLRNEVTSRIPQPVQAALFRTVQEAVTNVVRHSDATAVAVDLSEDRDSILLTVSDNGERRGLPEAGIPAGFGLAGLRERTEALGGRFTAGWGPAGFEVAAVFPMELP
ncbi:sensor histidine kinase [Arthrobacter sp. 7Tela_A1]|uniref:sensor histidine kinase n=1 Tax=Arthrobacter sp. 7Tela_A1 TaxID=3093745 RepID=UPI003BB63AD9